MARPNDTRPAAIALRHAGLLLALLAVGGCGAVHRLADRDRPGPPARVYSPNGEPLRGGRLGHPSCRDALSGWFDRVDANHDGFIGRDEFRADAQRQFAVMDLDHDGVITPDELARYRAPFEADTARRTAPPSGGGNMETSGHGHRRQGDSGSGDDGRGSVEQPDPVMLADVDLRNRVTLAQFMAYADRNFADLDANHDGRLDKTEILGVCGPPDEDR